MARNFRRFVPWLLGIVAIGSLGAVAAADEVGTSDGQWRCYGGDLGSNKYSPLDQINADNVGQVKVLWTWDSPDLPLQKASRALTSFATECDPAGRQRHAVYQHVARASRGHQRQDRRTIVGLQPRSL